MYKDLKLKNIKSIIENWDGEMSLYQFIVRLNNLKIKPIRHGIKCWDCGYENTKISPICHNCRNLL